MDRTGSSPPLVQRAVRLYAAAAHLVDMLQPIFALAVRLYVARVFFTSGMIKLSNWAGTLALFENEYQVPVLPPNLAAYLGTAAELGLPVLRWRWVSARAPRRSRCSCSTSSPRRPIPT